MDVTTKFIVISEMKLILPITPTCHLPEINFSFCSVLWHFKVDFFFLLSIKYYGLVIVVRNCFRLCIIYLVLWTLMQDYQDWRRGQGMFKLMMRVSVIPVMHALVRSYLQCILMTLLYVTRLVVPTFHVSPQSCYAVAKCLILGHLIFIPMQQRKCSCKTYFSISL